MKKGIIQDYDILDSRNRNQNLLSMWSIQNEFYLYTQPTECPSITVAFIPFKSYHTSITVEFYLCYHNTEELAPVQFEKNRLTFPCRPVYPHQYINYIVLPLPFSTYDCKVVCNAPIIDYEKQALIFKDPSMSLDANKEDKYLMKTSYRYVAMDSMFSHTSTKPQHLLANYLLDYIYTLYNEQSTTPMLYNIQSFDINTYTSIKSHITERDCNMYYSYDYSSLVPLCIYHHMNINDRYHVSSIQDKFLPHLFGNLTSTKFIEVLKGVHYTESEFMNLSFTENISKIHDYTIEDILKKKYYRDYEDDEEESDDYSDYSDSDINDNNSDNSDDDTFMNDSSPMDTTINSLYTYEIIISEDTFEDMNILRRKVDLFNQNTQKCDMNYNEYMELKSNYEDIQEHIDQIQSESFFDHFTLPLSTLRLLQSHYNESNAKQIEQNSTKSNSSSSLSINSNNNNDDNDETMDDSIDMNVNSAYSIILFDYKDVNNESLLYFNMPRINGCYCLVLPDHFRTYHSNEIFIPVFNPQKISFTIECEYKDTDIQILDKGFHITFNMNSLIPYEESPFSWYYNVSFVIGIKDIYFYEFHILFKHDPNSEIIYSDHMIRVSNPSLRMFYVSDNKVSMYYKGKTEIYKQKANMEPTSFANENYSIQFKSSKIVTDTLFYEKEDVIYPFPTQFYKNIISNKENLVDYSLFKNNYDYSCQPTKEGDFSLQKYLQCLKDLSLLYVSTKVSDVQYVNSVYNEIVTSSSIHEAIKNIVRFNKSIVDSDNNSIESKYNLLMWSNKIDNNNNTLLSSYLMDDTSSMQAGFGSGYILKKLVHNSDEINDISNESNANVASNAVNYVKVNFGNKLSKDKLEEIEKKLNNSFNISNDYIDHTLSTTNKKEMSTDMNVSAPQTMVIKKGAYRLYQQYSKKQFNELFIDIVNSSKDAVYSSIMPIKAIKYVFDKENIYTQYFSNQEQINKEISFMKLLKPIVNQWTQNIQNSEMYKQEYMYRKHINIILDCNFTHKSNKSKLRTLCASILLLVCYELGISTTVYANGSRNQGFLLCKDSECVEYKIAVINSLINLYKVLSSPLDLFTTNEFEKKYTENEGFIFVSDCLSSQLISENEDIHKFIDEKLKNIFLFQIIPQANVKDECLTPENQILLNEKIQNNFGNHCMLFTANTLSIQESIELQKFFYSDHKVSEFYKQNISFNNKDKTPKISDIHYMLDFDMTTIEDKQYGVLTYNNKNIKNTENLTIPTIKNEDLTHHVYDESLHCLETINSNIQSDDLFDSLNVILPPNKPTKYVPSVTGNVIYMKAFIDYIITNISNGKLFKKKIGSKIRFYSVSIVIDCTCEAFSYTNRSHSYTMLFKLLKGLQSLSITSMDIWIAQDEIIRVGTGLAPEDIWTDNTLSYILKHLQNPSQTSCLYETMKQALATCTSRPMNNLCFVLTNGVRNQSKRQSIRELLYAYNQCQVIGIGLGLSCHGYENIFSSFLWCVKGNEFYQCLQNYDKNSSLNTFKTQYSMNEDILNSIYKYDMSLITSFKEIANVINKQQSEIEIRSKFFNFDNIYEADHNIDGNEHDLGVDGGYKGFAILFVILYTTRKSNVDNQNVQKDQDITPENLRSGPMQKMISKGFTCKDVYNYYEAMIALRSGDYRLCCVTCSCGDGYLGNDDNPSPYFGYRDAFIHALMLFHQNGGGILWMLENYPYVYEAEEFFKSDPYKIESLVDTVKRVDGGCFMSKETDQIKENIHDGFVPTAGTFSTSTSSGFIDFKFNEAIDQGLVKIYEGKTLAVLNESVLNKDHHMFVFARVTNGASNLDPNDKNSGYRFPAIMMKEADENNGRMVIDTAASKLFMEWKEDGTPRYISNALIWCLNTSKILNDYATDEYNSEDSSFSLPPEGYRLDNMKTFNDDEFIKKDISPQNVLFVKTVVITFVVDLTGSTTPIRQAIEQSLETVIHEIEYRRKLYEGKNKTTIRFCVVGYRDYEDEYPVVDSSIKESDNYKQIINFLKQPECAIGGGRYSKCCSSCENICGGLQRAIKILKDCPYYSHHIILCGASGMHGCTSCKASTDDKGITFDNIWQSVCNDLGTFKDIQIDAFGVDCSPKLSSLYKRQLGNKISEVSLFKESIDSTFRRYLKSCQVNGKTIDYSAKLKYHTLSAPNKMYDDLSSLIKSLIKDQYTYDQTIVANT